MSYKVKMAFPVVGMLLLFGYAALAVSNLTIVRPTAFVGGTFEASGVASVPGTDSVLFVDDGRPGEIFWMRLDEAGKQAGAVKAVPLGVSVTDLEGMTTDGANFYIVGSQSKPKGSDQVGLVRFKFDAQQQKVEGVETISGLKRFLSENVAELRGFGNRSYKDGGINVEGIAWAPQEGGLLLGLRSPVIDGKALVIPLRLRDPQGPFSSGNLEVVGGKAIQLPLNGLGIRSIEYDERVKAFRLISGASLNNEKSDFKFWEWSGNPTQPKLTASETLDSSLKPEGLTRASSGGRAFTFIVFDTSGYSIKE